MKRSGMVELMALAIAKQAITSGNHNVDISWINVDALLDEMEKVGMQPPNVTLDELIPGFLTENGDKHYYACWEDE
jgi:hypothetical protein